MNKKAPNQNPMRGLLPMLCLLTLIFFASSFLRSAPAGAEYSHADIRAFFEAEQVETVKVSENSVVLTLKEPTKDGTSTVTNEYDSAGRLVKTENFDAEGAFKDRTSFEYDQEGNLRRSTYMDLNNVTAVTNYSYEVKYVPAQA